MFGSLLGDHVRQPLTCTTPAQVRLEAVITGETVVNEIQLAQVTLWPIEAMKLGRGLTLARVTGTQVDQPGIPMLARQN